MGVGYEGVELVMPKPAAERFQAFHTANPHVYTELVRLARWVKAQGYEHYAIRPLWEKLRWDMTFGVHEPNVGEIYRLNDHYKEFYSRLIMANEPDLADFFTKRRSRADRMKEAA